MRHAAAFLCLVMFLAGADAALIGAGSAEARGRSASRKATIQKQRQRNRQKAVERRARRKAKGKTRARRGLAEGSLPRPRAAERQAPEARMTAPERSRSTLHAALESEMTRPNARTTAGRTRRSRTSRSRTYTRRSALIPATHERVAVERSAARPRSLMAAAEGRAETTPAGKTVDRETVASRFIRGELRKSGKTRWELSTPVFQYAGDATNPVTGTGPIEVIARQKQQPTGLWGRITRALNPQSERRFMVVIDARGTPQVLSEQADSLPYRLMRKFGERVPIKEIASDAIRSSGVRNGAGLGVAGVAIGAATAGPLGWAAAGALILRGAKLAIDGVDRRRVARTTAMDKTVTDIKSDIKNGETVTLAEAYRTYKVNLEDTKPGTTPLSLRKFTAELSTHGL